MQARLNWTIPVNCALIFLASFAVYFCPEDALAVRPFVTDDARIVYKGQVATETYGGITMVKGEKPAFDIGIANAPLLNEVAAFHKASLLRQLQQNYAWLRVRDLRFKLRGDLG